MRKSKIIVFLSMVMTTVFLFNIVTFAERVKQNGINKSYISYNSSTDRIQMESVTTSGKDASNIEEIQAAGDFYRDGEYLDNMNLVDSGYSSATVTYNALAYSGSIYQMDGWGYYIMSSLPNYIYYDDSAKSYVYSSNLLSISSDKSTEEEFNKFLVKLDKQVASAFDIDLSEYEKMDVFSSQKTDSMIELTKLYFSVDKDIGDTKPSIYLNSENKGIILNQKADGTNKMYAIEFDDSGTWQIKSEDSKKGKLMRFKKIEGINDKVGQQPDEFNKGNLIRYENK